MTNKPKGSLLKIMHLVFHRALRDALNSISKHPNELDSKCRLALFRQIKTSGESCLVQGQCSLTGQHFSEEGKVLWEREVFWAKSKVAWITKGRRNAEFFNTEEQELRVERSIDLKCKRELSVPKFTRASSFLSPIPWEHHQKGHVSQNRSWSRGFIRLLWTGSQHPQQVLRQEICPDGGPLEMGESREQGNWQKWGHPLRQKCRCLEKSYNPWIWFTFSLSPRNP